MTQKSICSDHSGAGSKHLWGIKFYDSFTNWTLCLADIWWPDIESRHLCGLNFLPSSKYSQVKMRGYYKEWMDDRPIEFSNKTRWIFSALMRQTRGFARSWLLTWLPGRYSGGWAHLDVILCHLVSSLHFRSDKVPFLCFVSISSKLQAVSLHLARPLKAQCRQCSGSSITRDISQ